MSMFESITEMLSGDDALDALGDLLGGADTDTTRAAISSAVPAVLCALAAQSSTDHGAVAVFDLVRHQDALLLDDPGDFLTRPDDGDALGDAILGSGRQTLEAAVARRSGLATGNLRPLFSKLVPVILGFLGRRVATENMDQTSFVAALAAERTAIADAGMDDLVGVVEPDAAFPVALAAAAAVAAPVAGEVPADFGSELEDTQVATEEIDAVVPPPAEEFALPPEEPAVAAAPVLTETRVTSAPALDDEEPDAESEPSGIWWWLIPGLLAALVVALLLATWGRTDDGTAASTTTTIPVEEESTTPTAVVAGPDVEAPVIAATVADALTAAGSYGAFLSVVDAAGLSGLLTDVDQGTVLAPADAAFAALPEGTVEALLANPTALGELLSAHVIAGRVTSADLADQSEITTQGGDTLAVRVDGGAVVLGGATVTDPDLLAENGVAHGIDAVIVPAGLDLDEIRQAAAVADSAFVAAATDAGLNTFLGAADVAGLTPTLAGGDPVTVFAPTDAAFEALSVGQLDALLANPTVLADLLRAHTLEGAVPAADLAGLGQVTTVQGAVLPVQADAGVTVGGATISTGDVAADPSVIHIVDAVIVPDGFELPQADLNITLGLAPITFEVGSAVITMEGEAELDKAAAFLVDTPVEVEIAGHTDADGSEESNQELSQERAEAVMAYLVDNGVDEELLTAVGYGESEPIASNDTDEGKAQNRRIEFRIKG